MFFLEVLLVDLYYVSSIVYILSNCIAMLGRYSISKGYRIKNIKIFNSCNLIIINTIEYNTILYIISAQDNILFSIFNSQFKKGKLL